MQTKENTFVVPIAEKCLTIVIYVQFLDYYCKIDS